MIVNCEYTFKLWTLLLRAQQFYWDEEESEPKIDLSGYFYTTKEEHDAVHFLMLIFKDSEIAAS